MPGQTRNAPCSEPIRIKVPRSSQSLKSSARHNLTTDDTRRVLIQRCPKHQFPKLSASGARDRSDDVLGIGRRHPFQALQQRRRGRPSPWPPGPDLVGQADELRDAGRASAHHGHDPPFQLDIGGAGQGTLDGAVVHLVPVLVGHCPSDPHADAGQFLRPNRLATGPGRAGLRTRCPASVSQESVRGDSPPRPVRVPTAGTLVALLTVVEATDRPGVGDALAPFALPLGPGLVPMDVAEQGGLRTGAEQRPVVNSWSNPAIGTPCSVTQPKTVPCDTASVGTPAARATPWMPA